MSNSLINSLRKLQVKNDIKEKKQVKTTKRFDKEYQATKEIKLTGSIEFLFTNSLFASFASDYKIFRVLDKNNVENFLVDGKINEISLTDSNDVLLTSFNYSSIQLEAPLMIETTSSML